MSERVFARLVARVWSDFEGGCRGAFSCAWLLLISRQPLPLCHRCGACS